MKEDVRWQSVQGVRQASSHRPPPSLPPSLLLLWRSSLLHSLVSSPMPGHAPFPPFLLPSLPSSGGLVLGLTLSASARDLHEVLHEELVECAFVNHLHPWGKEGGREGGRGGRSGMEKS